MSYNTIKATNEELIKWNYSKNINPRTGRKISDKGKIYKLLNKQYEENKKDLPPVIEITDTYKDYRNKNIDPILLEELPIEGYSEKKIFKFKYKWNPYTGKRGSIDTNGCLSFDPDTLIHYFYSNRLNYLWESSEDINYTGYFGDALGNGPEFIIKGRGSHPDWLLFRLPIIDCYLVKDHCHQSVTMGPELTDKEIREIDRIAKSYGNNYKNKYKKPRPSLRKLKRLYDEAINPDPDIGIDKEVLPFVEPYFIKKLKHNKSVKAVEKLIKF